jgi:ATP-dependent Clp protease ATP-binding subunit ClpC
MKNKVQDELKNHFRPEFLNRIDDTIVFHQLSENEIIQIVDLMVANLETRLKAKDMGIELTSKAKSVLATRGYDPVLGARPLRRTIQREIEDALSEKILFGEVKSGQIILIDVEGDEGKETFTFKGMPRETLPDTPEDLAEAPTA